MIVQARFIGKDGSRGFREGSYYKLDLSIMFDKIWITHKDGVWLGEDPIPYTSMFTFLNNFSEVTKIK